MKRRIARFEIDLGILADILACRIRWDSTETNAPKDLKIISVYQSPDHFFGKAFALAESSEFAEVEEGAFIPLLEPFKYTRRKD